MLKKSDPDFKAWFDLFSREFKYDGSWTHGIKKKHLPILNALKEYCASYRTAFFSYVDCVWSDCDTCNVAKVAGKTCREISANSEAMKEWNNAAKAAYKAEYERLFNKGKK